MRYINPRFTYLLTYLLTYRGPFLQQVSSSSVNNILLIMIFMFTFVLFMFLILLLLGKLKNTSEMVDNQDDWEQDNWEQGNSGGSASRNWLFYFASSDTFRQNHSLLEVHLQIDEKQVLTHRFSKQTSSYLKFPGARISGKFEMYRNENAWRIEYYRHLSLKGFTSASLFRDISVASRFTENDFIGSFGNSNT